MINKVFLLTVLASVLVLPGCVSNTADKNILSYNAEPLLECVECVEGKSWNDKPCCTPSFEKDCLDRNGVIRFSDLHPVSTTLRACYQKSLDSGKECSSVKDCKSGVCDLAGAIKSNKCKLIKKELTGGKNQFNGQEFYNAEYTCDSLKPGSCGEAVNNRVNPGGEIKTYQMSGSTLIETSQSGPIF